MLKVAAHCSDRELYHESMLENRRRASTPAYVRHHAWNMIKWGAHPIAQATE